MCCPSDSVLSWGPFLYSVVSGRAQTLTLTAQLTSSGSVCRSNQASWVCLWLDTAL